jgi:hypothetical protein
MIEAKNCKSRGRFGVGSSSGPKLSAKQLLSGVASQPTTAVVERHLVHAVNVDDHEVVRDRGHGHRTGAIDVVPVAELKA